MKLIPHKHLKLPDDKRLFIIGDVHGKWDLYKKGVRVLGIDDEDVVISLGDLIDRGPDAFNCVNEFTRKDNRHAIMGNHEHMLVKGMLDGERNYFECWYNNGGNAMWEQYGDEGCTALAAMVEELPTVITLEWRGMTLAFAHGGWPAHLSNISPLVLGNTLSRINKLEKEKVCESIMWDRDSINCALENYHTGDVLNVDLIFHGHSYVKEPLFHHNRVYMDTGSVFNGNLTFASFDLNNKLWFYSTLEED